MNIAPPEEKEDKKDPITEAGFVRITIPTEVSVLRRTGRALTRAVVKGRMTPAKALELLKRS